MSEKQQVPSAGPDFVTKLPQDQCGDECCGEAKVKAEEMRAIEYGDDVEVPIREHS